mmetsp:Transcript_19467/g.73567  ORF Transcript_19467/g.73567 Transcript_19467/m.73567 type:complete len:342 (+) Transcript_19467:2124-3149(+)|eukprot:scaffold8431_cov248-Pinguiococcus_pyrenoidosus.AAC.12
MHAALLHLPALKAIPGGNVLRGIRGVLQNLRLRTVVDHNLNVPGRGQRLEGPLVPHLPPLLQHIEVVPPEGFPSPQVPTEGLHVPPETAFLALRVAFRIGIRGVLPTKRVHPFQKQRLFVQRPLPCRRRHKLAGLALDVLLRWRGRVAARFSGSRWVDLHRRSGAVRVERLGERRFDCARAGGRVELPARLRASPRSHGALRLRWGRFRHRRLRRRGLGLFAGPFVLDGHQVAFAHLVDVDFYHLVDIADVQDALHYRETGVHRGVSELFSARLLHLLKEAVQRRSRPSADHLDFVGREPLEMQVGHASILDEVLVVVSIESLLLLLLLRRVFPSIPGPAR